MTVSQLFSIASANRNSNFLTLFPVKSVPVRSSRLIKNFEFPKLSRHGSNGVGVFAKFILLFGTSTFLGTLTIVCLIRSS